MDVKKENLSGRKPRFVERVFHLNFDRVEDRNAWNLCVEIFWAAILGAAATFNAAFAVRLEADNFTVSLLTSLPSVLAVLISIPAGRFLERQKQRKGWIVGSLAMHRTGYLIIALVPWLKMLGAPLGSLVVGVMVVNTAAAHFFNVGWIPMLADVTTERRRAALFAARNIIASATNSVFVFLFGQWLDQISFPVNYQTMYVIGYVASVISLIYILKIQIPEAVPQAMVKTRQTIRDRWQAAVASIHEQPLFWRITRNTLLHGIGLWTAAPLYVLYYVRELGASEGWLGLQGMILSVMTIIGYTFWRWVIGKWGEPTVLMRTIIGPGMYPLLAGLLPGLTPILAAVAWNGFIAGGVNLSHFNTFLKVCPEDRRPSYYGIYATIMNIGAFVCPFLGVALAENFGYGRVLVGCGVFSVLGSMSFWFWRVTPPQGEG